MPVPKFPNAELFWPIFPECLQMAVLIFFISIAMVKICTEKHEYEVNDNQELVAYGLTNIACSFFSCFPACTAPARNMILSSMGVHTTLNGIFTSIVLLLVLYVLGQLFSTLPIPALSVVIIGSVKPLLLQARSLPVLFRRNVCDGVIWTTTCLTGVLLDLPYGLMVGIATSLVVIVINNQRAPAFTLVRNELQLFVRETPGSKTNGVLIFKMCSSLYFATSERFKRELYATTINPLHVKNTPRASSEITVSHKGSDSSTVESILTNEPSRP
ncbi:hypothetical protein DPMN_025556 [Dreissena polymorpha]|uniref:SLC26A/SulP transporter domain-containing protein n=2 Tax=Dreissena polymorpha TaxID=45954 RepID=A0A9D4LRU5_DREPO|nr:hypothetical protein DPMN_025556 [Dreissena polymorpha]